MDPPEQDDIEQTPKTIRKEIKVSERLVRRLEDQEKRAEDEAKRMIKAGDKDACIAQQTTEVCRAAKKKEQEKIELLKEVSYRCVASRCLTKRFNRCLMVWFTERPKRVVTKSRPWLWQMQPVSQFAVGEFCFAVASCRLQWP